MSLGDLSNLVNTVFGAGGPNASSAQSKLNTVARKLADGDTVGARQHAKDLITFIQQKASQLANPGQVQALIDGIECFAGITSNTFLVFPTDAPQTITSTDGQAGVQLPANPVSEPTLITVSLLDPNSTGVLITKLDQYPGYVEIQQQSNVGNSLLVPVVVAVCPAASVPADVRSRLRLGHQSATNGFEVTPPADGSFLTCTGVASIESKLPGWVSRLASLVLPKPLYARMRSDGGVGGTATEFSPFGPVDTELSFSGGVGGTATEFQRAPAPTDADRKTPDASVKKGGVMKSAESAVAFANAVICDQAVVGSALPADCRPLITLTTHNGTALQNAPVTWAIGQGGGVVAPDNATGAATDCGTFGATASTSTNANGRTRACWTLGAEAGTNTVVATPHTGGDVPAGVTFVPATNTFTATAMKAAATLTLSGLNQTYTGSPLAVTVATTPSGLNTVSVTYNGSATAPTEAGSYAVVATLSNPSYEGTANGTLVIAKAAQLPLSVSALSAPAVYGTSQSLSTSGGTGSGAVTFVGSGACSTSGNTLTITSGTGTCTITATKSGGNNYADVSASLDVTTSPAAQGELNITGAGPVAFGGSDVTLGSTGGSGMGGVTFDAGSSTACTVTSAGVVHATTGTGTCVITATKAADANYTARVSAPATMTVTRAHATLTLGNLTQGYDGTPKVVSVTTAPVANLATVAVTYGGSPTQPSAAGDYAVIATLSNPDYEADAASGTLTITKASQSITFAGLAGKTYGDADFTVGATATSALAVTFTASGNCTVAGSTVSITGAGACTVTAHQAGDGNYLAAPDVAQGFAIAKAAASVTLGNLAATYTGSPIGASVATSATGSSAFIVTYDGSANLPVNAGSYAVVATLDNPNFTGGTAGTLVIAKATATIMLGNLTATYDGSSKSVTTTTNPAGLGVIGLTYNGSPTAPTNAGSYPVIATLDNANYIGTASGSLVISPATPTITWANPANIPLGTPLSGTQLNASASTFGAFAYTPPAGTVLAAGPSTLSTLFTPTSANFASKTATVSINVRFVQVGCFSSPIYNVMPDTKSYQRKGSNLQVKCQLTNVQGVGVLNATGNLKVEDLGVDGATPTGTPLLVQNAFKASNSGNYAYGLDTSPASFISLHYYRVTASWSDGSTTVGWFYIR